MPANTIKHRSGQGKPLIIEPWLALTCPSSISQNPIRNREYLIETISYLCFAREKRALEVLHSVWWIHFLRLPIHFMQLYTLRMGKCYTSAETRPSMNNPPYCVCAVFAIAFWPAHISIRIWMQHSQQAINHGRLGKGYSSEFIAYFAPLTISGCTVASMAKK